MKDEIKTIGTLSEKSTHSFIKDYIEPDKTKQEVKVGRYIADIKVGNTVYEIQTQQFKKLVNKIQYYISKDIDVKIVYPLANIKHICWINVETGGMVDRTKSTKHGVIQDIFKELYWIVDFLDNEHVTLQIMHLDIEEYKYLDGYDINNKIKATKIDKIPNKVLGITEINNTVDLIKFIPDTLPNQFTAQDLIKNTRCNKRWAGSGIKLLREKGIIKVVKKQGNQFIYERCK